MKRILLAGAIAGIAAAPVLAMEDMTCADFTAMDAAGQAETIAMMEGDTGGMMADTAAMAPEETAAAVGEACADHPDMMLGEALEGAMMPE
jgi:hypothetical protein